MSYNLTKEGKTTAVSLLCEGNSIRSIERITGIHRDTIMRLGVRVGQASAKIADEKMRGLSCKNIEVDEIWGFIGAKKKNVSARGMVQGCGDVWTFIALDVDTKLIPSFVVGKRDAYHTKMFIADLASRVANRVQVSSDAMAAYADAMERGFGTEADYGQISKTYSVVSLSKDAAHRYSPAEVVKVEKAVICGLPDVDRICTSHVEKQNHTLRMHCRRLSRLTNAFSKKFENFQAAVSLNFAYYNFVKTHGAIRMTPAQAAGVESSAWTVAELVERCGDKQDYLARLQTAVQHLHNCAALHRETVPVREIFKGKTIWQGDVEVYDLTGHPKAKRAYAWSHRAGKDDTDERFVAVLEIPPVESPQTAVKVAIAAEVKSKR
jgi:IS1 family transposase